VGAKRAALTFGSPNTSTAQAENRFVRFSKPRFYLLGLRVKISFWLNQIASLHRHISDTPNILEVLYSELGWKQKKSSRR
jgi:hypothetical protein